MQNKQVKSAKGLPPIIILGIFYFIFGFATWLNGVLIPYLKIACELNDFQSYLVTFAFYIAYFFMALPCAWILNRTGFKNGMSLGLFIMASGALIFIPAAFARNYSLFLLGLFVLGTGLTILQAAVNPYVTIVGPIESAAKRISIMGICNKLAGVLAPLILGAILLSDADKVTAELKAVEGLQKSAMLNALAQRVVLPYGLMALILTGLGFMVRFSPLPAIETEDEAASQDAEASNHSSSVFQFPNLVLGVIALFLYVGVEVIAVDTITNYGLWLGVPLSSARIFPSYTLVAMVVGYITGIISIPKFLSQPKALAISAVAAIVITVGVLLANGSVPMFAGTFVTSGNFNFAFIQVPVTIIFMALLGIANAIMWPAIWPLAIHGLGQFTKTGSALLIMAIVGGATLPLLYGKLAALESVGHQKAYLIILPCYLFILFYSIKGYKIKKWG